MANPSYLALTTMFGQILYSGQIAGTSATTIYTVPSSPDRTVKVASGTICNTSASPVNVSLSVLKVGDSVDGTHLVLATYPLAAGDTLPLKDYLGGLMLATGEAISITVSTGAVIDVVLSGTVSA